MAVTLTFDLEDHRAQTSPHPERFGQNTRRFLVFCEEHGVRATFFVVGELAVAQPSLVAEIAAAGHEIALHGWRHVPLAEVGPAALDDELRRGKAALEDVTGCGVAGYRAPIFSLTPQTAWAVEALVRAGFTWSSSVLPANNPLHGWPGAPRTPFHWDEGLVELPCPVLGLGRASVPFLGGVYLRYLPAAAVRHGLKVTTDVARWSYLHPYDLDPDEPFFVMPHTGWLTSRILHARRAGTLDRAARMLGAAGGPGPVMGSLATAFAADPAAIHVAADPRGR